MSRLKQIFFFLLVFCLPLGAEAANPTSRIDSLKRMLSNVSAPADSIGLLYDLYDLSHPDSQRQILRTLFYTSQRAGNHKTLLEAARRLSISYLSSDSVFNRVKNIILDLPPSRERDETLAFISIQRANMYVAEMSDDDRLRQIAQLITEEDDFDDEAHPEAKLDHLLKLYTLVIYLSNEFNSSILPEYLDKLEGMVKDVSIPTLHNQFYTRMANVYTASGEAKKAVDADRQLLKIIDTQEDIARSNGREFANFNRSRYNAYRRMLGNYPALSRDEIDQIYNKIRNIADTDKNLTYSINKDDLLSSYYLMATDQFAKAIPVLKKQLTQQNPVSRRLALLNMLRLAAKNIDDEATLIQAMRDYNSLLESYQHDNSDRKYRELQIKYQVNRLRSKNAEAEIERRDNMVHNAHQLMWISIVGFIVVLTLLAIIFFSYRRARRLSAELASTVDSLESERDSLKKMHIQLVEARNRAEASNRAKDEFLHSMSHEIRTPLNAILGFSRQIVRKVPPENRDKIARYSEIINLNGVQLEKIIDDVLYLSSIDLHQVGQKMEEVSVKEIMADVVQQFDKLMQEGVELKVIYPDEDIRFTGNRRGIEQVLSNLLSNSIKFTSKGYVEIRVEIDREAGNISFIVTDTGIGIPADKKDVIFERFSKLNQFSAGTGLGLYISRHIATTLGGDLTIDTDYSSRSQGTRFIFTVPLRQSR